MQHCLIFLDKIDDSWMKDENERVQVFSTTGNFVPFSTIHGIDADHLELIQLNLAKSAELSKAWRALPFGQIRHWLREQGKETTNHNPFFRWDFHNKRSMCFDKDAQRCFDSMAEQREGTHLLRISPVQHIATYR